MADRVEDRAAGGERSTAPAPLAPYPASEARPGLRNLLEREGPRIAREWREWLATRATSRSAAAADPLLSDCVDTLVSILPETLGPRHDDAVRLWSEVAELYGSVAAMRGLAAGEAVEEFQFLREAVVRALYAAVEGGRGPSLRELLALNRVLDRGVAQTSVGHTDALFFALFRGTGIPDPLTPELAAEIRCQLRGQVSELGEGAERP